MTAKGGENSNRE